MGVVPVGQLSGVYTPEVQEGVLEVLEFYLVGSCEPYVIPESEWALQATEERLRRRQG